MAEPADEKRMTLRYASTCRVRGTHLPAHEEAIYERATRTVRCLGCPASGHGDNPPAPIETGSGPPSPVSAIVCELLAAQLPPVQPDDQ